MWRVREAKVIAASFHFFGFAHTSKPSRYDKAFQFTAGVPAISEQTKAAMSEQFENIQTWADMYDTCDTETKKMILSRICGAVRVSRDYNIEIDLTMTCDQLGIVIEKNDNKVAAS
jgi:hypothetical protein